MSVLTLVVTQCRWPGVRFARYLAAKEMLKLLPILPASLAGIFVVYLRYFTASARDFALATHNG